jgi:hypothetical protein
MDSASVTAFNAAIGRLKAFATDSSSARTRETAPRILRDEMRLLVQKCIEFTPPATLSGSSIGKKLGETATTRDIKKVFMTWKTLVDGTFRSPNLARRIAVLVNTRDYAALNAVFANIAGFANVRLTDTLEPSFHTSQRNNRGRISSSARKALIVKNPSQLTKYIQLMKGHVGKAKAGWNAAATKFKVARVPAWVTRHKDGQGSATDILRNGNGYLEAVNSVPYIGTLDAGVKIIEQAVKSRTVAIELKLKNAMEREVRNFGT